MVTHDAAYLRRTAGVTIVELIVVMGIIGILAGLTMSTVSSYRYSGRDAERISDAETIARSFEISYLRDTTVNGPTYPTTQKSTDTTGYNALFRGQGLDAVKAPETIASTSIVAATSTSLPQSPTKDQYVYLPLTASGNLCNGTDPCVRFYLFYRLEGNNTVQTVESIHQQ